ncbi:MAG: hypothetical protein ABIC04_01125, partial [Nanoarchaeota archaeon]
MSGYMMATIKTIGFLLLGLAVIISFAFFWINILEYHNQPSEVELESGNEFEPIGLHSESFGGFALEKEFFDDVEQSTKILYRRNDEVLKISSIDNI